MGTGTTERPWDRCRLSVRPSACRVHPLPRTRGSSDSHWCRDSQDVVAWWTWAGRTGESARLILGHLRRLTRALRRTAPRWPLAPGGRIPNRWAIKARASPQLPQGVRPLWRPVSGLSAGKTPEPPQLQRPRKRETLTWSPSHRRAGTSCRTANLEEGQSSLLKSHLLPATATQEMVLSLPRSRLEQRTVLVTSQKHWRSSYFFPEAEPGSGASMRCEQKCPPSGRSPRGR